MINVPMCMLRDRRAAVDGMPWVTASFTSVHYGQMRDPLTDEDVKRAEWQTHVEIGTVIRDFSV